MEVHALAAGIRLTPRKARLVAATIVGLPVNEALTVLKFTPKAAAHEVAKVIKSAAANAEHNYELDVETLRVARIEVDGARTIKRYRPRAQGRAFTILKRTVHVRAVVTDDGYEALARKVKANTSPDAVAPRRRRGAATRATAAAPTATAKVTKPEKPAAKAKATAAETAEKPRSRSRKGSADDAAATVTTADAAAITEEAATEEVVATATKPQAKGRDSKSSKKASVAEPVEDDETGGEDETKAEAE